MERKCPVITVVTPSYNQGQFIRKTIESVLNQGVAVEHLVFDACSTDETVDVLKSFDSQIIWVSEPDGGQTDAVNKGLKIASADVIGWLNSDDIYYPGALKKVVDFFHDHPDVDVLYGRADHIKANGDFMEEYPTEAWNYERLKETCFICQPAVFFRKKVVGHYGPLNDALNFCMDYEYWLRIGKDKGFAFVDEKLAGSRLYDDNKTLGSAVAVHEEIIKMFKEKFGKIPINWIYGYAHAYARKKYNVQMGEDGGPRFRLSLALSSLLKTVQYRNVISLVELKKIMGWFFSGVFGR